MTDPYNVSEKQDPQSKNMVDQIANRVVISKEKDKKNCGEIFSNFSTLYNKGLNHFENNNIFLELDNYGEHCYHNIWVKSDPVPIKGINYPKEFKVYRPLWNNEDFQNLFLVFNKITDEDLKEFWTPLVFPKGRDNNLSLYSERLAGMKKIKDKYSIAETFNDLHTHDPSANGIFGKLADKPKTWVPSMDWFDDKLKSLTFDDIFVLLPQAERDILKLWLGRVGCGRSRHIPINSDNPIIHTARMAIVLLSKQAGVGKSTLTRYLYGALNKCGFCIESFRETRERFGMGSAAKAHILEKDK